MKLILIAFILMCSTVAIAKDYNIKQGTHGGIHFGVLLCKEMKREVIFDNSAIYTTSNPQNQGDINKLFGFSDCNSHHQKNSARFGWRWFNNQLEIHAYNYVKSARQSQLLEVIDLNRPYKMSIAANNSEYIFKIEDRQYSMPRGCSQDLTFKYFLFPYFGGDETAPHDISIEVSKI